MKISIVIPAFNEEKLLGPTLANLRTAAAAFTVKGWQVDLIVCDNNSTDRTAEIAREAGAQVVFEPVNQIGRARNRGAGAAVGDWLLFVDADSKPSYDLFSEVVQAVMTGKVIGGGVVVRMDERSFVGDSLTGLWNLISRFKGWAAGSFIFCERAAFVELGGFSPELFASEEIEFCRRLNALARVKRRRVVILHRFPMITSARKLHLYSRREYARLILKIALNRRALQDRSSCHPWYDGRR